MVLPMVLADTSVWIRFLAGREPYSRGLDRLLDRGEVVGHDMVHGELLVGDRGGRAVLLDAYARMLRAPSVAHAEVVDFVQHRRLGGRGAGWIDMHLLASAVLGEFQLWTADQRLADLAKLLGVEYTLQPI